MIKYYGFYLMQIFSVNTVDKRDRGIKVFQLSRVFVLFRLILFTVSKTGTIQKYAKKLHFIFYDMLCSPKYRAWIKTASETQRHLCIFCTPNFFFIQHGAFVSLWLFFVDTKRGWHPQPKMPPCLLTILVSMEKIVFFKRFYRILLKSTKTIDPKAQSKKTSLVVKENLSLKNNYIFARFVPSGFFYKYICTQNETGPKRLNVYSSPHQRKQLCIYSFGAFLFHPAGVQLHINDRRGAGAILRHVTSSCYYGCLTFMTKRSAIACCTSAVFFLFLFFALNVSLIQTQKKSNGGDMHNV